jgi:predicted  nucleic acid-binding Zn-ribbon protein
MAARRRPREPLTDSTFIQVIRDPSKEEYLMARWQPRTPKESLEASLERIKTRVEAKKKEMKELEDQKKQVEAAIKALSA